MRFSRGIVAVLCTAFATPAAAQFAPGDRWYQNPLGFAPLRLHTAAGLILPAAAAGAILLLTDADPTRPRRRSVFNETTVSWGYKYPNTRLTQNNTGVVFLVRPYLSLGVEADIYWARDDFNRTTGVAVRPFARFYPVNGDRGRLYFESGGGLLRTATEFPQPTDRDVRLGTTWNGTTKYGLGAEVDFGRYSAVAGVRHTHVSNGNTKGVQRNPSHDSNGVYLGLARRF